MNKKVILEGTEIVCVCVCVYRVCIASRGYRQVMDKERSSKANCKVLRDAKTGSVDRCKGNGLRREGKERKRIIGNGVVYEQVQVKAEIIGDQLGTCSLSHSDKVVLVPAGRGGGSLGNRDNVAIVWVDNGNPMGHARRRVRSHGRACQSHRVGKRLLRRVHLRHECMGMCSIHVIVHLLLMLLMLVLVLVLVLLLAAHRGHDAKVRVRLSHQSSCGRSGRTGIASRTGGGMSRLGVDRGRGNVERSAA